jgi:hypothetical protein
MLLYGPETWILTKEKREQNARNRGSSVTGDKLYRRINEGTRRALLTCR